jgi:hypothetical protein
MSVQSFSFCFDPLKKSSEPLWKDRVDRWYQLDETSMAVCSALFEWNLQQRWPQLFDQLIYISDFGSNLADAEFVAQVPPSPSRFVYTLPSIAPAVINQFLAWSGPVYCLNQTMASSSAWQWAEKLADSQLKKRSLRTLILVCSLQLNATKQRLIKGYMYE